MLVRMQEIDGAMSRFMSFIARPLPRLIVDGFGSGAAYLLLAATEGMRGPYSGRERPDECQDA